MGALVTLHGSIQTRSGRNHKVQLRPFDFIWELTKFGTIKRNAGTIKLSLEVVLGP